MRVLLVEPYFTGSHRAWAEGYRNASRHDVHLVTLDGQFWRWRMTGAHLALADRVATAVDQYGAPDVVLATSMLNLPALLAHTRRSLGDAPAALYMHENQLTYIDRSRPADYSYAATNWTSMTAADTVVFNSEFHKVSWFEAARSWLGSFPDHSHEEALDVCEEASVVVPVGIDLHRLDGDLTKASPLQILWNHRADTDKAPERFVDAMLELDATGREFTVAVCGERFVDSGSVFDPLEARLGDRVVHNGFADDGRYGELLRASSIVVSTAVQEFYGISITEAVYCGAFPTLPHRLVYPERIPEQYHDRCLYRGRRLPEALAWAVDNPEERQAIADRLCVEMVASDWTEVGPELDAVLEATATGVCY